jgi:hypothetical protein
MKTRKAVLPYQPSLFFSLFWTKIVLFWTKIVLEFGLPAYLDQ